MKNKVINLFLLALFLLSFISLVYGKLDASQERIEILGNRTINHPEATKKIRLFLEENPEPSNSEIKKLEDGIDQLLLSSAKQR